MHSSDGPTILVVLSVIGFVAPIIFGFVVYKLRQSFVTLDKYNSDRESDLQRRIEDERRTADYRRELIERLDSISKRVDDLLTARRGR